MRSSAKKAATPAAQPRQDFHLRWAGLGPPQRPPPPVVELMRPLVAGRGTALQLGITPEIAYLSDRGVAVDCSPDMIRAAWPGDSATHRAMLGNWLALPLETGSVDIVYGDACLSVLGWPDEARTVLRELARVLRPGGRLVLRCFAGPDVADSPDALAAAALAGQAGPFGAFKLRFNMAAFHAAGSKANTGHHIHELFQARFPDRSRLAAATGWAPTEIRGMDAYEGSLSVHSYPTRRQISAILPAKVRHRFVETAGYPLAARCPLLVVDHDGA